MRTNAEEFQPAGIAPISRKTEVALHKTKNARRDAVRRNAFEIEISTLPAVGVSRERESHAPGIKSKIAGLAPPRPQPGEGPEEIENSASARSETVRAAALGTNHRRVPPRAA